MILQRHCYDAQQLRERTATTGNLDSGSSSWQGPGSLPFTTIPNISTRQGRSLAKTDQRLCVLVSDYQQNHKHVQATDMGEPLSTLARGSDAAFS